MLDVEAADALRTSDLVGYLRYLAGPETWPTLRLALAAPLHALAGPSRALAVEHGLSLALAAALFLALGFAARCVAPRAGDALLVLLVSAAVLAGIRPLFVFAADAMLEVPSALLTLASAAAWLASRDSAARRPWALAIFGNLLFHVKWQHGMILAAAVLLTEAVEGGALPAARALGVALVRGVRMPLAAVLLAAALAQLGVALWARATGGGELALLGQRISLHGPQGPLAFGALSLFAFLQLAWWRGRADLSREVPDRVRFLWAWLATPMGLWLLVPFTWRLRVLLLTSFDYVSGETPEGLAERLLFYPRAAWNGWIPTGGHGLVLVLAAAVAVASWRSTVTRRLLAPFTALVLGELLALVVLNARNYQARFILNLAPVMALWAASWVPAVPRPRLRAVVALAAASLVAWRAAPAWGRQPLVATLAQGFESAENGDACRGIARALPLERGVLQNQTSLPRRQTCALWVKLVARERGADVDVYGVWPRARWQEALVLAEGCGALRPPEGLVPEDGEVSSGPVCGQRFRLPPR
jgi:hypothetical protein